MTYALELRGVQKRFGLVEIIREIDLNIPVGQRHILIGPNGAGKSTLFNLISGRMRLSAGTIWLHGKECTNLTPFILNRRGLSRSFQISNVFPRLTVLENFCCAAMWSLGYRHSIWRTRNHTQELTLHAQKIAASVGLDDKCHVEAGILPYADLRALEIGMTIASAPKVILLDEPTAGMSREETERTIGLIRRVSEGRTLLMVEHDMNVVFKLADVISVLAHGHIVASGTPEEIRDDPAVKDAYLGSRHA
jgi:branched-chain amino acid transport system ATP-binding protein